MKTATIHRVSSGRARKTQCGVVALDRYKTVIEYPNGETVKSLVSHERYLGFEDFNEETAERLTNGLNLHVLPCSHCVARFGFEA